MVTLVTGGTGFVGANIVKDLVQNGHQVVSFDINGPDQLLQDFLGESSSSVIFVQGGHRRPSISRAAGPRPSDRQDRTRGGIYGESGGTGNRA